MRSLEPGLTIEVSHDFEAALGLEGSRAVVRPEEWDALLQSAPSNVVFMTWQWQRIWWRHFGAEAGCTLHLLAVRREGGALAGIAPLFVAQEPLAPLREYRRGVLRPVGEGEPRRLVHIVGGVEVADYLDVIAAPDDLAAVWSAALDYLLAHRTEWDCIDLHSLAQWTPSREILRKLAPEKGFEIQVLPEDVAPVLELPDNWDAYLAHLRKKDRHELRRKVRKLEGRDDVTWHLVPTGDRERALEAMRTFIKLHRKSGPDKAHFMNEQMAAFFMDMAAELAPTGLLELSLLDIGDHAASAYLSFSYNKRLYLYNSGYDPRFASYSAGMALLAYRIHKAIVQGLRYFDFLRGDEPYKYDFGGKDTFVYRALLTPAAEA